MKLEIVDVKKVHVSNEDIRNVLEIMVHPEILRWDTEYRAHTFDNETFYQKLKDFFKRALEDEDQLCLLAKMDGRIVGFLGIHCYEEPKNHVGDVGIMVNPDYQRRGIGTQLLKAGVKLSKDKGIRRLEADTLVMNVAMRRTAEKAGFQVEGIRSKEINMHGELKDSALYALLLQENK